MTEFVVDASVTLAWCFEDEATPETDAVLDRLEKGRARVPGLWALEVANVIALSERRGRLTPAASARAIGLLHALPIDVDPSTWAHAFRETLAFARAYSLTVYDAAYLELAIREALPLATLDRSLATAARALGVEVLAAPP